MNTSLKRVGIDIKARTILQPTTGQCDSRPLLRELLRVIGHLHDLTLVHSAGPVIGINARLGPRGERFLSGGALNDVNGRCSGRPRASSPLSAGTSETRISSKPNGGAGSEAQAHPFLEQRRGPSGLQHGAAARTSLAPTLFPAQLSDKCPWPRVKAGAASAGVAGRWTCPRRSVFQGSGRAGAPQEAATGGYCGGAASDKPVGAASSATTIPGACNELLWALPTKAT